MTGSSRLAFRYDPAGLHGHATASRKHQVRADVCLVRVLEADFCHVALRASVRPIRSAYVGGSATALTLGAGAATALVALSAFLPIALLPLPMAVGVGYATLRRYRPVPARVLLGLERVLDSLETGGIKPVHQLPARGSGILEIILGEVRRSLESPTRPRPSGPRRGTNGS